MTGPHGRITPVLACLGPADPLAGPSVPPRPEARLSEPQRNGGPVTFREFDDYRRSAAEAHREMSKRISRNDGRIDALESWKDRIAGPIAVLLAVLAIVATGSNLLVIWLGVVA